MAIKGKKRTMPNTDVPVTTSEPQQPLTKKVKAEKSKPVQQTNGVVQSKQKKTEKKQKAVLKNEIVSVAKVGNGTAPTTILTKTDKKNSTSKDVVKAVDDGAKMAALIKQTAKRKEQRKAKMEGFAPELIKATPEQLQEKIDEIMKREVLTKTARRRLAVLKKKLLIKQGLFTTPAPKEAPTMSKNTKRKLRRMKKALELKNDENGSTPVGEVKDTAVKAAKAVKGLKATMAEKKSAQNMKNDAKTDKNVDKKKKQGDANSKKKLVKVQVEEKKESEEEDEEDEEDEDEEQDDNMDVSNNSLNTEDDEEEDDDDEEEDDDDEEEEEEDDDEEIVVKKPISKPKKENKQLNAKPEKKVVENGDRKEKLGQKNQNQNTNETQKKTRFVLFVGNIPYTSCEEELTKHFLTKVSEVASVRIPLNDQNKPRGFAYVEFNNRVDYEKGLSLHETQFNGKRIRVQYSTSGNKDESKKSNFAAKNNKLHALRKQGKLAGSMKDSQKRNARRNKGKNQAA